MNRAISACICSFVIACGGGTKQPATTGNTAKDMGSAPAAPQLPPQKAMQPSAMCLVVEAEVPGDDGVLGSEVQTMAYAAFSDAGWKVLVDPASRQECSDSSAKVILLVTKIELDVKDGTCVGDGGAATKVRHYGVRIEVADLRDAAWKGSVSASSAELASGPVDVSGGAKCGDLVAAAAWGAGVPGVCVAQGGVVNEEECEARAAVLRLGYARAQQRLTGQLAPPKR